MKRNILNFTTKISKKLSKPKRKFVADITYGILASGSCLLTDVVDQLHEDSKKLTLLTGFPNILVRELLYHNKWTKDTELRNRRKGKVKMPLLYKGKEQVAYLSHIKVQITTSRWHFWLIYP